MLPLLMGPPLSWKWSNLIHVSLKEIKWAIFRYRHLWIRINVLSNQGSVPEITLAAMLCRGKCILPYFITVDKLVRASKLWLELFDHKWKLNRSNKPIIKTSLSMRALLVRRIYCSTVGISLCNHKVFLSWCIDSRPWRCRNIGESRAFVLAEVY